MKNSMLKVEEQLSRMNDGNNIFRLALNRMFDDADFLHHHPDETGAVAFSQDIEMILSCFGEAKNILTGVYEELKKAVDESLYEKGGAGC